MRWAFLALALAPYAVTALIHQEPDPDIQAEYLNTHATDSASKLLDEVKSGVVKLPYEPKQGYLKALLMLLGISPTSQILCFSKTSIQIAYISQDTPRAIYFNDHAYVGWIPDAPNIEITAIDPQLGPIFYTLPNQPGLTPKIGRKNSECLQCHEGAMTDQVPGVMARSVYASRDGFLQVAGGSKMTTARSPIKERWGGWFVTGKSGQQHHMGNEPARGDEAPIIDTEKGSNVTDLRRYFDVGNYLSPHSDIVALMVAEQQMTVQNLITKAAYGTRKAVKDSAMLLKFGFTADHVADEIHDRIRNACEPLVEALLCSGEPALSSPVAGTSGFTAYFSSTVPADKVGRRLSELDLKTRLLRYPCSPMIYSQAFQGLPAEARAQVFVRFKEVLSGKDQTKPFAHLKLSDRVEVKEILSQTLPGFA